MEQQKKDAEGIKTHEEILALLKSLESMEERIKNPELLVDELFEPDTILQEVERPQKIPSTQLSEPPADICSGEMSEVKYKKKKRSFVLQHRSEKMSEGKIKRVSFWRTTHLSELKPEIATEIPSQEHVVTPRSTFVLHVDENGNIAGFPIKKPKPVKEKRGFPFLRKKKGENEPAAEEQPEEPVKGIKGKLKKVTSKLRRKKSAEEGTSAGGIASKLKGVLRRKPKE